MAEVSVSKDLAADDKAVQRRDSAPEASTSSQAGIETLSPCLSDASLAVHASDGSRAASIKSRRPSSSSVATGTETKRPRLQNSGAGLARDSGLTSFEIVTDPNQRLFEQMQVLPDLVS